jgi:COP9 signalosome complex subunit 2
MSDFDDDNFMVEDDEEYDFDYEEDEQEEPDVDLENSYYNAKGKKADDIRAALKEFQNVVDSESEKGEWWEFPNVFLFNIPRVTNVWLVRGFRALKQMIKIATVLSDYKSVSNTSCLPITRS